MIKLSVGKFFETLAKIKLSVWQVIFALLCSFNLWFLTFYFFKPTLLENHGLNITLMTTLAITVPWYLISFITTLYAVSLTNPENFDLNNEGTKKSIGITALSDTIIVHGGFLVIEYFLRTSLIWLIILMFCLRMIFNLYLFIRVHKTKKKDVKEETIQQIEFLPLELKT